MAKVTANYRGVILTVESDGYEGRLFINGLIRARIKLTSTTRLSSTVQTDYEWHELIEGTITRKADKITISLSANNVEIALEEFPPWTAPNKKTIN